MGKKSTSIPLHQQMEAIFTLSEDSIIILDANHRIIDFNQATESLLGWKKEELIGEFFKEVCLNCVNKSPFPLTQVDAVLQGNHNDFEYILYRNNTKRYITWKFSAPDKSSLIILGKDTTDQKRLALQNVTIFDQIKKISAAVPGNFYWKNKNEEYLGCNKILLKTLGFNSMKDIVGKTDYDLWPEHADELKKNDEQVIQSKRPIFFEETVTLDGKKMYFTVIKMPLLDDEGNIIGILGNSLDITELKKTQADLKVAKEIAEQASHAKTEFLANMSHDIRTPLTGIIGMSKMLEETVQSQEEKQYASWVNDSGEQLLKFLNGVLDVISAEHMNEDDLHLEPFNLQECLEDLSQLERPAMVQKNLDFNLNIPADIPSIIITDRFKLSRILLNLLGNAIKFTEYGSIKLAVHRQTTLDNKELLAFSVSDTGKGIPKEAQKRVFERFYRVSPSYKNDHHGHGVGLHIVEKYIGLLGGKIELESEEGKGTTFFFTIPLFHSQNTSTENFSSADKNSAIQSSSSHVDLPFILLVEDNTVALKVLEGMVAKTGCAFLSATSGEEGLQLAKKERFDLVITDIGLPGISGNEMTRQIRAYEKETNTPALLIYGLTGHAVQTAEMQSLQAGMNGLFTKPMTPEAFKKMLETFRSQKENAPSFKKPTVLSANLPDSNELFALDRFSLLDIEKGITTLGNLDILKELLETMVNHAIPAEALEIKKAYAQNDWETIENLVHKMKSGALYCGAVRMQYACHYLEHYRKTGENDLLDKLYHQLIQVVDNTKMAMNTWLKETI